MQVLECISCINKLAKLFHQGATPALPLEAFAGDLRFQLETLRQIPSVVEDNTSGRIDEVRIGNTAELYRLAALIYFHKTIPSTLGDYQDTVRKSLGILCLLDVCTSPWPLFVTACEVVSDEDRLKILDILENMQLKRRIANVDIMRGIIESLWKQQDLLGSQKNKANWRQVAELEGIMPSFI